MPTQPFVRSPKCTLPSRPRVMPSSRPMYWAKMRRGSTPRMMWAARSRCRMHRRSWAAIAHVAPGGDGLLAEPVVEAAGHLALAVERHRALFDAAHHQHRAQQARRGPRWSGARLRRAVTSVRAVSVAIWRFSPFAVSMRRPGSPGGAPSPGGRDLRWLLGLDVGSEPIGWRVTLDGDDGRVRTVAATALAAARARGSGPRSPC